MKINHEMNEENTKKLEDIYKYVYQCKKCSLNYGSDKEEKKQYLCPICE